MGCSFVLLPWYPDALWVAFPIVCLLLAKLFQIDSLLARYKKRIQRMPQSGASSIIKGFKFLTSVDYYIPTIIILSQKNMQNMRSWKIDQVDLMKNKFLWKEREREREKNLIYVAKVSFNHLTYIRPSISVPTKFGFLLLKRVVLHSWRDKHDLFEWNCETPWRPADTRHN